LALCALLAVQAAMLTWIDWRTAPTWDEWGHLPSGLYHVQYSEFRPYSVNPPLVRSVAALPLAMTGNGLRWLGFPFATGGRPEWVLHSLFVQTYGERCFELFSWARMALIPGSWLGTYLLWSIGKRSYGHASGWVAAVLWTFSPMALSFGGTIAPDVWGATFGFWAAWRFYVWLVLKTWPATAWLGACVGLALLCKSTWIILPPLLILLWSLDTAFRRLSGFKSDLLQGLAGMLLAWLVVQAGYDFRGVLRPLGSFEFHSHALTGHTGDDFPAGNRFADTWLGRLPALLPADYVQGIDIQKADFEGTRPSYLFGQWQDHGWWYYYLVGIPLKEPIALWGLAGLLITAILLRRNRRLRWREGILFAPGLVVLLFVSSQTGFSHHLRYALPFYPCLYLFLSRSAALHGRMFQLLAVFFCLWFAGSSAANLPRSFAFFSEAVGGASQGWRYLSDSNLDWGQDLLTLRDWAKSNPDKRPIWLLYSPGMLEFEKLGIDAQDATSMVNEGRPHAAGWWAVFATPMTEDNLRWFREQPATIQLSPVLKMVYVPDHEEK
jgi:hypothetical protein